MLLIHLRLNVLPGFRRERHLSRATRGGCALNDIFDQNKGSDFIVENVADQHAADFNPRRQIAVRMNFIQRRLSNDNLEIVRARPPNVAKVTDRQIRKVHPAAYVGLPLGGHGH